MNYDVMYNKIVNCEVTLDDFRSWLEDEDQESYDKGYSDGNRDGYDECRESTE